MWTAVFVVVALEVLALVWLCKYSATFARKMRRKPLEVEWTQDLDVIEVNVPLPEGTVSKDVDCRFLPDHLFFQRKGQRTPTIDGKLLHEVVPDECTWQVWPVGPPKPAIPRHAKITLLKRQPRLWSRLLRAEEGTTWLESK